MTRRPTVAVVGLGAAGLVALKNLKEEGFDVVGFERNNYVGGLWKYSENDQTSVLATTVVNISKERGCFTDFPYSDSVPSYPTAAQVHRYLNSYATHFDLIPHCQLNVPVQRIIFDDEHQQWAVEIEGRAPRHFDKVVIAIGGMAGSPNVPNVQGLEKFQGQCIHSQAFKRPSDFQSLRVMVVGFGNSAADTATQLAGVADKVYLAHRHGARILPRGMNGQPIDHVQSYRLFTIQSTVLKYFPRFGERVFDRFLKSLQDKAFKLRPEWRFDPAQKVPIVSDNLVDCLEHGSIESVTGLKHVTSGTQVELDDGRTVEIDALIWCTGYRCDFSMVDPRFDPTASVSSGASSSWAKAPGSNNKSLFRLYQNVFSLSKPESLAFIGNVHLAAGGFQIFDMAAMAITQVWKGTSQLPPIFQMNSETDRYHIWLAEQAQQRSNVSPGNVNPKTWLSAMDTLGGTMVNDYLSYGWKGWWFWLSNMSFCNLLMGGIWTPHIYRVFDGKRKKWDGARRAIEEVNAAVAASKSQQKAKRT